VLCSDTVGFVRKLPHQLVDAFHATLEVVGSSDLLVHVVDASAADPPAQIDAVHAVLTEIGAGEVPELLAFNKADLDRRKAGRLMSTHPGSVACSALTGRGMPELLRAVADQLRIADHVVELAVPVARGDVVAAIHREGEVIGERYEDECVLVTARLDERGARRYAEFVLG
jgi:GTP-binding protein HflX